MKFVLTLGVALAAVTLAASAHATSQTRTLIRHGADIGFDADNDGWLTRAEAAAAAERVFDDLDANDDGRLDAEDRRRIHVRAIAPDIDLPDLPDIDLSELDLSGRGAHRVEIITENGERRVIVDGEALTGEERARIERQIERAMAQAERAQALAERSARGAERAARDAERRARRAADEAERVQSRQVVVIRANGEGDVIAPVPPAAPVPPRAPMFMMLIANSEEADLNGDGAISREEFRAQQLRYFDAADANGDSRIRVERPPEPPAPPAPPAPPRPR